MLGKPEKLVTFAAERGMTITTADAAIALTKATDFINSKKWSCKKADKYQADAWPRIGIAWGDCALLDATETPIDVPEGVDPRTVTGTPQDVFTAVYRLALLCADGFDLMPSISGAQEISVSAANAISVTYDKDTIGMRADIPWLDGLIGSWTGYDGMAFGFSVSRG